MLSLDNIAARRWPMPFSSAMHYSTSNYVDTASFSSCIGRGQRVINCNTNDMYSQVPAAIPSFTNSVYSLPTAAGLSQRILNGTRNSNGNYNRSSRLMQNIAATGTGSSNKRFSSPLPECFSDNSSVNNSKTRLGSGSITDYTDPVLTMLDIKQQPGTNSTGASKTHVNASAEPINLGIVKPADLYRMRDSSILWMNGIDSELEHHLDYQQAQNGADDGPAKLSLENSSSNSGSSRSRISGGAGTGLGVGNDIDTSVGGSGNSNNIASNNLHHTSKDDQHTGSGKFMFYSGQTGAMFASSLVEPVCGALGIDSLIDTVLTPSSGNTINSKEMCGSTCFWLDIAGATTQEITDIGEIFELHPLTVEDIIFSCPRDKIDTFADYSFIVYSAIAQNGRHNRHVRNASGCSYNRLGCANPLVDPITRVMDYEIASGNQVCIVVRHNYILTFHSGSQRLVVSQVLKRLLAMQSAVEIAESEATPSEKAKDAPAYTKDAPLAGLVDFPLYIVYAILDEVTDQLSPEILVIEQQVDAIDELVLVLSHTEHENMLRQMGEQRRRILATWQCTQPKLSIIERLAQLLPLHAGIAHGHLADEVAQYLSDVHGHLLAAVSSCTRAEAVLSRSHSNYLAKISLELARATFDSNSTTERWTMLGTIVVPINIVSSFLGVNLKVPGQDRDDTLNFFLVMGCMIIYACATLAFWRWRQII
ncbi:CorA metal ion transporter [Kickxella alabastrina]|nr:CorA metal ion transporter [Kickxella alabastrina]